MEEVRQLVQEEGREARNLVAFHVAVDTPARVSRKPPRALPPARRALPRATRLRSASAGRDKRSELRARYWALLFGDLQRAVGEIYNTVEAHENLNECQEVILVLENYTRDFKALGEWFRLKWEYDNTPPPQRPQSLAWEIRKTDFVRPESRRTHSVKSSPSVSGKNSPCFSGHNTPSGKNSPNLTGKASPGSGKISPRISVHPSSSPKANIEFFSNKIAVSKITAKPEPKIVKETSRLTDIKEKDTNDETPAKKLVKNKEELSAKQDCKPSTVEIGTVKEYQNAYPKQVIIKPSKHSKFKAATNNNVAENVSCQAKATMAQLDVMENEFLAKQLLANQASNDNMINRDIEKGNDQITISNLPNIKEKNIDTAFYPTESPTKSEDNFADVSNESSPKIEIDKNHMENDTTSNINTTDINKSISENTDSDMVSNIIESVKTLKINELDDNILESNTYHNLNIKQESMIMSIKQPEAAVCSELKVLNDDILQVIQNNVEIENPELRHFIKQETFTKPTMDILSKNPDSTTMDIGIKVEPKDGNEDDAMDTSEPLQDMIALYKEDIKKEQESKKLESKSNNDNKQIIKAAYSQAAAKPKQLSATKTEIKTPTRLARSSTVVEMRPTAVPKTQRPFQKKHQTNKCSYPFNLTTGRSSLFDGTPTGSTNKGTLHKRPISRNTQLASGDAKPIYPLPGKEILKKRPPRPTALKVSEKSDKKETINSTLDKNKDCKDYGSTDTIVTQIDMSRIESSESLKTLVPEDHIVSQDVANSIEVLNIDNNKNDNEGWRTVKSRRLSRESKKHSKSYWANRFRQPSATTSLPTLNMLESPKQETKNFVEPNAVNIDRARSEQPQTAVQVEEKMETDVKVEENMETDIKVEENVNSAVYTEKLMKVSVKPKAESRDPSMIRQKSDVTGLKTRSSRNKVLTKRAEKIKDEKRDDISELTKNRLHSSLESLTTALARSQESTEEVFDFDKWKAEFKSTYLEDDDQISDQNEILETADPSEMSEIAEMTSQIEENERKIGWALDFQSEVDQRKLCEEEDLLNRQILELQQVSDIDMDTETDDTETDAEVQSEDPQPQARKMENLGSLAASLEDQYETALAGMSWAERVDTLVVLEALVARDPGRAQQLHAKLSQGIKRRGSLQDALRRLQAKQARAERQRMEYQTERAKKIHQLLARVEEVKVAKNQLIEEKRIRMERRLQKATENRDQHLKDIVRKAHDEEEKLREIAFIKQLEAENRRHEFLDQCRSHTTRLRQMRRDRLQKLEQKSAREAAVGARRHALEEARRLHVESIVERRKERDARVEEQRELRRQERDDAAREKAEGVKSRLSALAAAAELEADALRSRIRDKQDASQQRLESHLQAIREKATTGPRQATTSESQDTQEAEQEISKQDQERKDREKQKAIKKKARKLKQKLLAAGHSNPIFEDTITSLDTYLNSVTSKIYRVISSVRNIITPLLREPDVNGTDRKTKLTNGDLENDVKKNKKKNTNDVNSNNEANINREETNPEEPHTSNQAEKSEEPKKKNKKKKNGEDKPKLTKASSVCSSTSDMSRGSRNDRKTKVDLDLPFLEKQMNELYRIMEKFEKHNLTEKMALQRFQAVKVISQMLEVAAEKEDINPPISAKCICAGAGVVARALAACSASAAQLLATNTCVHLATLLARQLDKNLQNEQKELELAKQLADCLSIALDSVLCATRIHEENEDKPDDEVDILVFLRNRAHQIISYLCLSGCITKAERGGEVRESIQTLLTVSADLCHPFVPDIGNERTYAKQALRTALGKSMCGSRAEFCMLFAKGASLGQCGDFVRAARTAHFLRAIAEMDHQIVQDAFGEGGWPLEFRAAVARLLSQHAPNEKEAPRTTALHLSNQRLDHTLSETMVMDLIVLVGCVIVNNPQLQETICDGWGVIKALCTLPANWFVSKSRSHALLPTLIALAERPESASAIACDVSMKTLEEFFENPDAQKIKLIQLIKQGRMKKPTKK